MTWPRPFQGWFCHPLATINLSTKFKVSVSIHYDDMKGYTKFRKWGIFGYLLLLKVGGFDRARTSSYYLLAWSANLAPPLGATPLEFRRHLWQQKTTIVWSCLRDFTYRRFCTILACDVRTDRQTQGRTHDYSIALRRAVNIQRR